MIARKAKGPLGPETAPRVVLARGEPQRPKVPHSPLDCQFCKKALDEELADPHAKDYSQRYINALKGVGLIFHEGEKLGQVQSKRFVSIELEVSADTVSWHYIGSPAVLKVNEKWGSTVQGDGNGDGGFEVNTAPASGDKFDELAKDYEKAFKASPTVKITTSCGGHVHSNARDFCYMDIRRLLLVYWLVEPAIYKLLPSHRLEGRWCQKLHRMYLEMGIWNAHTPEDMREILYKGMFREKDSSRSFKGLKYYVQRTKGGGKISRYYGLNLGSWFVRGTIEFRQPPGMILASEMIGWARFFNKLMWFAKKSTDEEIEDLIKVPKGVLSVSQFTQPTPTKAYDLLKTIQRTKLALAFMKERYEQADEVYDANKRFPESRVRF